MFDAIGIISEDPNKSVRFYNLLGVELKKFGDTDHYEAITPSGVRILLDSIDVIQSFEPDFKRVRGNGMTLCFKQDSARKVDELHATLTRAGHKSIKEPWDAFWGQRYACVADPDGNQIDLFASL
jgi:catechol 2,3-dioxygenase-like lactoylglutathione lyase family enzyme